MNKPPSKSPSSAFKQAAARGAALKLSPAFNGAAKPPGKRPGALVPTPPKPRGPHFGGGKTTPVSRLAVPAAPVAKNVSAGLAFKKAVSPQKATATKPQLSKSRQPVAPATQPTPRTASTVNAKKAALARKAMNEKKTKLDRRLAKTFAAQSRRVEPKEKQLSKGTRPA